MDFAPALRRIAATLRDRADAHAIALTLAGRNEPLPELFFVTILAGVGYDRPQIEAAIIDALVADGDHDAIRDGMRRAERAGEHEAHRRLSLALFAKFGESQCPRSSVGPDATDVYAASFGE